MDRKHMECKRLDRKHRDRKHTECKCLDRKHRDRKHMGRTPPPDTDSDKK